MQFVTAFIKPHHLDAVHKALIEIGADALTFTEVENYRLTRDRDGPDRQTDSRMDDPTEIKLELAVADAIADRAIQAIHAAARAEEDMIFVLGLTRAVRVRTGETDLAAL